MYIVQTLHNSKCNIPLSEFFRNQIWTSESLLILWYNIVGIATWNGMESLGITSQWEQDFPHPSRPALGPTQPPIQMVPRLSQLYSGGGVVLTTHPHPARKLKREYSYTSTLPPGVCGRSRVNFILS
jgi:hypothetical protein